MKRIILYIIIAFAGFNLNAEQWDIQSLNYPYSEKIICNYAVVDAIDTTCFYLAHSTSTDIQSSCQIMKTSNSGLSWDTLFYFQPYMEPLLYILDMAVMDSNNIAMLIPNSRIIYTHNAGLNWDTVAIDQDKMVRTYKLKNWGDYLVAGDRDDSTFVYSEDYGESWNKIKIDATHDIEDEITRELVGTPYINGNDIILYKQYKTLSYRFADAEQEYSVQFLKSSDKGTSWSEIAFIPFNEIMDYEIGNDGNIYTVSSDRIAEDTVKYAGQEYIFSDRISYLLRINPNTNVVDTLFNFDVPDIEQCKKLDIFDNKFVASFYNKIYVSDDYGSSFRLEKLSNGSETTNFEILSTVRPIFEKGMLVGMNSFGTISYPVSVDESRYFVENISVYPNPISSGSKLNLEFDVKEAGVYSYKLSTIDGRAFNIGSQSFLSAGSNNIELQLGSNLAPGAYFLSILRDGEVVAVKKVIVE